jgi:Cu2+-exporting ATPase
VRIAPGEVLAADGVIVEGESRFDESPLTGESRPVPRGPGDPVIVGSCNREQPVLVRVTRVGEESTAGEVRQLLDHGLKTRPRYAELAERVAEWFVPVVLLVAGATAAYWLWVDPARALAHTVSVLIVTCPCALALATPVAVAVATGRLAEAGVLPLRLSALEALAEADLAALDKTGTLTLGELEVSTVELTGGRAREQVLAAAAALEAGSEHPVGRALRRLAPAAGGPPVTERHYVPGAGVAGLVAGEAWRVGSPAFATPGPGLDPGVRARIAHIEARGERAVLIADEAGVQAVIGLTDRLRPGAESLAAELARTGLREVVVLSGDARAPVHDTAGRLGIPAAHAELDPAAKLAWLQARQAEGRRVLMVGDGINDAPTLAAADVSASFAGATDLAQLTSDFVVLGRDLGALPRARRLAQRARAVIRQNLAWAAAYNLLSVPAAAAGLVPPWAAALGMSASSLLVVANAMRLARRRP